MMRIKKIAAAEKDFIGIRMRTSLLYKVSP